jgi:hypothetical protein
MPRKINVLLTVLMFVGSIGVVHAQTLANGNLTGRIVSASADNIPAGGTETVLTTPSNPRLHFVLTQVCLTDPRPLGVLGSTVGYIAGFRSGDERNCTALVPGFALPPNEVVQCVRNGLSTPDDEPLRCSITGVLTR